MALSIAEGSTRIVLLEKTYGDETSSTRTNERWNFRLIKRKATKAEKQMETGNEGVKISQQRKAQKERNTRVVLRKKIDAIWRAARIKE